MEDIINRLFKNLKAPAAVVSYNSIIPGNYYIFTIPTTKGDLPNYILRGIVTGFENNGTTIIMGNIKIINKENEFIDWFGMDGNVINTVKVHIPTDKPTFFRVPYSKASNGTGAGAGASGGYRKRRRSTRRHRHRSTRRRHRRATHRRRA